MQGDGGQAALEPLHRRPNGPTTKTGDNARGNAPPLPSIKFNSRRIIRIGSNKRTTEKGATEDNS